MKTVIGIIAAVLLVGIVGGFIVMNKDDDSTVSNTTTPPSQATNMPTPDMPTDGRPASDASVPDASQSNTVIMSNLAFSPSTLTVKKGTTVTWSNQDDAQHDVNPDNPTDEFKKSALFGKGGSYSVTFNTAGTYTYKCTPHPFMKGTVVVTE